MTGQPGLEHLLAPVGVEAFFRDHWERAPLVVQDRPPDHHAALLTLAHLDHLLAEGGIQHPGLRLVRGGEPLPRSLFTEDLPWGDGSFRHAVRAERVLEEHRAGATVVFQALHRTWGPLMRLCRDLEARLACRFQANAYLTPPEERGLDVHFDRHDVFVLQVHGSKEWTVWDSAVELPTRKHRPGVDEEDLGEPLHRLTLGAGDLLYLPRGFPHRAETGSESSVHVALGVVTTTWLDVFGSLLVDLHEDPRFRRSLPTGTLTRPASWPDLEDGFRELCRRLSEAAELAPALDRLATRFAETRTPLVSGRLEAASAPPDVGPESVLVRSPRIVSHLSLPGGDGGAELVLPGKRVVFPEAARPALERMETGEPFVVSDLPGRIDAESREVIARRLLKEGYLVQVSPEAGPGRREPSSPG